MTKKTEKKEGNISINTDIKKTQKSICKYDNYFTAEGNNWSAGGKDQHQFLSLVIQFIKAKMYICFMAQVNATSYVP